MTHVALPDGGRHLDLDRTYPAVVADGDDVDFVIAVAGAHVSDPRLRRLCCNVHAQGGERRELYK